MSEKNISPKSFTGFTPLVNEAMPPEPAPAPRLSADERSGKEKVLAMPDSFNKFSTGAFPRKTEAV